MKRQIITRLAALFGLALLALPVSVWAGDPPQEQRPQGDRLARIREAYHVAEWPASGPAREGVNPRAVEAAEWQQSGYEVDPRRGEGVLRLTRGEQTVVVTARLFERVADARAELVGRLATMQRVLEPVAGVGEVSFGVRDAKGRLSAVLALRGNVLFDLRALDSQRLDGESLVALGLAVDQLVLAAPLEGKQVQARPRLLGVNVTATRAGEPARVTLDLDPAGAPATHVVFECSGDAGVLETNTGYELMAPTPGTVRLTVFAASKDLRVARAEVTIEVAR